MVFGKEKRRKCHPKKQKYLLWYFYLNFILTLFSFSAQKIVKHGSDKMGNLNKIDIKS